MRAPRGTSGNVAPRAVATVILRPVRRAAGGLMGLPGVGEIHAQLAAAKWIVCRQRSGMDLATYPADQSRENLTT